MHIKQAKIHGERELRLHHVAIWRESPLFSARERAALAWTEVLTKLPEHGVPDDVYAAVLEEYSEQEIVELTYSVLVKIGRASWRERGCQSVWISVDAVELKKK